MFQTHPWTWVCLFLLFSFPEGFYKTKKTFWKPKNIKENQKKPSGKPKKKCLNVSDPPLDVGLFFLFFFVFLECLFGFVKTFGNSKNKTKKTYPRVCLKHLEFFLFYRRFCLFSLVVFGMFGFLYVFVGFVKTFGKTKKNKKENTYSRVGLKPLKTCLFLFSRRFFWFSLVVFCIFVFSRMFVWFCENLRENQKNKKQNISKGGHETFKNLFFGFPECCFCCLWFSLVCLVFPNLFQGGLDA